MVKKRTFAEASEDDGTASPENHSSPNEVTLRPADHPNPKIKHTDPSTPQQDQAASSARHRNPIKCELPPHKEPISFVSFHEYDSHYASQHMNRCKECGRNLPSEHFLGLHIAENHDTFVEARRERGDRTYACFVPTCDRVCSTPWKRRLHLIDKHYFPPNYNIYIVNDGIDRRISMLRSPRHKHRFGKPRSKTQKSNDRDERRSDKRGGTEEQRGAPDKIPGMGKIPGKKPTFGAGRDRIVRDGTTGKSKVTGPGDVSTHRQSSRESQAESSSVDTDEDSNMEDEEFDSEGEDSVDDHSLSPSDDEETEYTAREREKSKPSPIPTRQSESSSSPLATPMTSSSGGDGSGGVDRERPHDTDPEMTSITESMSALRFVPQSVRFGARGRGRGRGRGGLARG
ncbi:MAG: hypothetical protein M1831_005953 [Alyxoria varia]|nr:MAG: hypothetical protein M1831_005953 [Alyxoria varia]